MVDERVASLVERCIVPVKQEYLCAPEKARVAVPPLPRELEAGASDLRKSKTQKKRVSSHLQLCLSFCFCVAQALPHVVFHAFQLLQQVVQCTL
jgi:hypothetical protein